VRAGFHFFPAPLPSRVPSVSLRLILFLCVHLLPNRHAPSLLNSTLRPSSNPRHLLRVLLVHTRAPLQQTLLDRTARLPVRNSRGQSSAAGTTAGRRRDAPPAVGAVGGGARVGDLLGEVRDGVRGGMGVAEAADQGVVGFAGFGEGVVAAVEVLALLQLGLQQVFFGRQFAVEAEEFLLFFGEGLGGGVAGVSGGFFSEREREGLMAGCVWEGRLAVCMYVR